MSGVGIKIGFWSLTSEDCSTTSTTLCIAFREDEARHRAGNTAQNLATLRHFALNIVRHDGERKVGVANSRKRAGFDRNYLIKLLTGTSE